MNTDSKMFLSLLLGLSMCARAEDLTSMQYDEKKHEQYATYHRLVAVGLRLAETGAGIHMLWHNSPLLSDFLYFAEEEMSFSLGIWGIFFGKTTRKRSMVPLALIELTNRIPTRLVGGLLAFDGLKGILKELDQ